MRRMESHEVSEVGQCIEIGTVPLELALGLPAGSPIKVNSKLNEQGRLMVRAKEPRSGHVADIEVQTESAKSKDEVEEAKARGMGMAVS